MVSTNIDRFNRAQAGGSRTVLAPVATAEPARPAIKFVRIDASAEGQRIDNFLVGQVKGVPRSRLYRGLRQGEVRVNKGRVKPSYRLRSGDLVRIPPLRAAQTAAPQSPPQQRLRDLELAVLYEDERIIALNKPSGVAVHGGSGLGWGLIEAMRMLRPKSPQLELVHRLDRDTSGCLLLSKRRSVLRELHRLMRSQAIDKRYLALLNGRLKPRKLRVDAPLRKNLLRSGERVVRVDQATGKPSTTLLRTLRSYGDHTLIEARLVTGRTHQIRVHAAHLGFPVSGDEKYGDADADGRLRRLGLNRLFLHASSLELPPGLQEQPLRIEAPLPSELQSLIDLLEGKQCATS